VLKLRELETEMKFCPKSIVRCTSLRHLVWSCSWAAAEAGDGYTGRSGVVPGSAGDHPDS